MRAHQYFDPSEISLEGRQKLFPCSLGSRSEVVIQLLKSHNTPRITWAKMENTYQFVIYLLTVIVLVTASWYAYNEGYADPLIEKYG